MIAAIIILFRPDHSTVARLLSSLNGQVDAVFAIDNTPDSSSANQLSLQEFNGPVIYTSLGENRGIAEAQNIGISASIHAGFTHVLLMDQDSYIFAGTVKRLLDVEQTLLKRGEKIAVVSPRVVDEMSGCRPSAVYYRWFTARELYSDANSINPIKSDNLICSGSLIRTSVLQSLGLMRSDLFIDGVDTEWMLRSVNAGYLSYCVPDAVMMHRFGDGSTNIMGKSFYLYPSVRNYYRLRNEVYLTRLRTMGWQWRVYALSRIPIHFILYAALAKNRRTALRLLLKALSDGMLRLGPLVENSVRG